MTPPGMGPDPVGLILIPMFFLWWLWSLWEESKEEIE